MNLLKKIKVGGLMAALLLLVSCATTPQLDAPCDAYGHNCDPKVAINQWTPPNNPC